MVKYANAQGQNTARLVELLERARNQQGCVLAMVDTPPRDRPEIQVTPEMVEAGAVALDNALFELDWQARPIGMGNCRAVVQIVFAAMLFKVSMVT